MLDKDKLIPKSIKSVCELLGVSLPADATCVHQPSYYIGINQHSVDSKFSNIVKALEIANVDMNDLLLKMYRRFKRTYMGRLNLQYNETDYVIFFLDWYIYAYSKGYSMLNYFDYEFYWLEVEERMKFLGKKDRVQIHRLCTDKKYEHIMMNKADFYRFFSEYVNRDWVYAKESGKDKFFEFVEKHPVFFAKPVEGSGGGGARKIKSSDYEVDDLYNLCLKEDLIAEEIIVQRKEIARYSNGETTNTVRLLTLNCADNVIRLMAACGRFGRNGAAADNFCHGGICTLIDVDSGHIISDGIHRTHKFYSEHPDSHMPFKGFQYPQWDDIKKAALNAAEKIPQVRNIGWDITILEDGKVEFIEGNSGCDFDVIQVGDQIGKRHLYEKYIEEIKQIKST